VGFRNYIFTDLVRVPGRAVFAEAVVYVVLTIEVGRLYVNPGSYDRITYIFCIYTIVDRFRLNEQAALICEKSGAKTLLRFQAGHIAEVNNTHSSVRFFN
jgi:hypothetical protein